MTPCPHCPTPLRPRRDTNHVLVSGTAYNDPNVIPLKNNKRLCLFTLITNEEIFSRGRESRHQNFLQIEVLGKNIDKCLEMVRKGERFFVSGYLRTDDLDGVERTRVRAYNVQKD